MAPLWPVIVGFLLTTVLGGFLASLLQRRAWTHQHIAQVAASERKRSVDIFEEVSRLLDKRLYRLRLLYWSLPIGNSLGKRSELATQRMEEYRSVLYEWNDGINRNLALVQQYFGDDARYEFDNVIGIHLIELGRAVEDLWNGTLELDPPQKLQFEGRIQLVSELIYYYNITLLALIRADSGAFGRDDIQGPGGGRGRVVSRLPQRQAIIAHEFFQRPPYVQNAFGRKADTSNPPASPTHIPHGMTAPDANV